jgi:hypothetical protein
MTSIIREAGHHMACIGIFKTPFKHYFIENSQSSGFWEAILSTTEAMKINNPN